MEPYWQDETVTLHVGDCLDVLRSMPDASVDAVVTDPPAAIAFMGRSWDSDRGGRDRWIAWIAERMEQACRVLKPGGHALVWALPRTSGWTQIALEDAGLEIRDCIVHLFGSGYPKSLDVSKAIDKRGGNAHLAAEIGAAIRAAREARGMTASEADRHFCGSSTNWTWYEGRKGICRPPTPSDFARIAEDWPELLPWAEKVAEAERETVGEGYRVRRDSAVQIVGLSEGAYDITAPATEDAARWQGWGTALKPGQEIWWLARKPLASTVAATVLEHGTGALNVAACRVGTEARVNNAGGSSSLQRVSRVEAGCRPSVTASEGQASEVTGRWPANIVLTHSATCEVVGSRTIRGDSRSGQDRGERPGGFGNVGDDSGSERPNGQLHGDQVADIFACSPDCPVGELDRQSGVLASGKLLPHHADNGKTTGTPGAFAEAPGRESYGDSGGASRFYPVFRYQAKAASSERPRGDDGTAHETVKPLGLMQWLARLITPPGGTVLDMFAGSGTTAEACIVEGFCCVLIEAEQQYAELIRKRLRKDIQPAMFGGEVA